MIVMLPSSADSMTVTLQTPIHKHGSAEYGVEE